MIATCGCTVAFCVRSNAACGCTLAFCVGSIATCGCILAFCVGSIATCGYKVAFCVGIIATCDCKSPFCVGINATCDCITPFCVGILASCFIVSVIIKNFRTFTSSYIRTTNLINGSRNILTRNGTPHCFAIFVSYKLLVRFAACWQAGTAAVPQTFDQRDRLACTHTQPTLCQPEGNRI